RNASEPQSSSGPAGNRMLLAFLQSSTSAVRSTDLLWWYELTALSTHSASSLLASFDGLALAGCASAKNIAPPSNVAASNLRMRMARPFLPVFKCVAGRSAAARRSDELEDETDEGERLGERDAEEHRR